MLKDNLIIYRVLLIEDSSVYTRLVGEMLAEDTQRAQFRLLTANTLISGLAVAHDTSPDVILLDLLLPDSHGMDTFLSINNALPHIPIVVLSGLDDESLALAAMRQGAQDYLIKGETDKQLLTRALIYAVERNHTAHTVQQEKNSLQALFDNIDYALLIVDDAAQCLSSNPAACTLTGYRCEEMSSLSFWDIVPPIAQDLGREVWQRFMHDGRFLGDFMILCKDGRTIICECSARANFLPGKHLMLLYDVSERKRTELALRESEQRFRDFMDNAQDGFILADETGLILLWNPAMKHMTQLPVSEVIGKKLWEVQISMLPPEKRSDALKSHITHTLQHLFESGELLHQNRMQSAEIVDATGERHYVQAVLFPVKARKGFRVGCMMRDITERRQLEESMFSSLKLADLSLLLAGISQEFNAPLQTITATVNGLQEYVNRPNINADHLRENLAIINHNSEQCLNIVNTLTAYARLHLEEKKPQDLNAIIQEALERANKSDRQTAPSQEILDLSPELPLFNCHRSQMLQALSNVFSLTQDALLSLPHSPQTNKDRAPQQPNEKSLIHITTRYQNEKDHIILQVVYNCLDISKAIQGTQPALCFATGRPIGLNISILSGIVSAHGGHFTIDNKTGGEVTFTLVFPLYVQKTFSQSLEF